MLHPFVRDALLQNVGRNPTPGIAACTAVSLPIGNLRPPGCGGEASYLDVLIPVATLIVSIAGAVALFGVALLAALRNL